MKIPGKKLLQVIVFVLTFSTLFNPLVAIVPLLKVKAAVPNAPDFAYTVLAAGERSTVFAETEVNTPTLHNGTEWYFTPNYSMGFAKGGDSINQNSADVGNTNPFERLSWHLSGTSIESGYRAGNSTGLNSDWTRDIYQSNTLPSYYPEGPQINVNQSDLTGWSLCFRVSYADTTLISNMLNSCTGTYILMAGGQLVTNKINVTKSGNSVLNQIGGVQTSTVLRAADNLEFSLYQPDLTTGIMWTTYRVYTSNCLITDCGIPGNPLIHPESWNDGVFTSFEYTIPSEAASHYLAVVVADDQTESPVSGNYIVLTIQHTPVPVDISDCEELQAVEPNHLGDAITLTQDIDCSETVDWNMGTGFDPLGDQNTRFTGTFNGAGHTISNLFINRGETEYIGLFGVIEEGASVHDLNITDANITGNNYVGALAGALSGTATNIASSGQVHGRTYVGGLVGWHTAPIGTGSSSPLVYTWNGTKYTYVADVGRGIPRNTVGDDYTQIDSINLAPKDGQYSMNISEEYNEIVYYDELALNTFDHAPGYRVLTSLVRGTDGQYFTASENPSNPLQSCVDQYGNDCKSALEANDDQWSYKDDSNLNYWTMDFGDLSSASRIQLLIQGARDFSIKNGTSIKYIKVKNAQGDWVDAYTSSQISTLGGTPLTKVVDLTGKFPTNDYHVQVAFDRTRMNYFAIDTSTQQPYTQNTYHPTSANLQFRGFSAIDKTYYWNHNFDVVSDKPDELFAAQTGNFTKYGDVAPLLAATDDQPVVIHTGDNMDIKFDYVAPAGGMERSFVLFSWATFKHADMGPVGRIVEPIPFVGMHTYPDYNYPLTPENMDYLRTWNTRVITGATGGSSTIITSHSSADVYVENEDAGGLVGFNDNNKLITGSYFTGNIYDPNDNDADYIGGIAGENLGTIEESYFSGNIFPEQDVETNNSYYVGGITGYNNGPITKSFATGSLIGYQYVGGLIGENDDPIDNVYSRVNVSGNDYLGGLVGYNYSTIYKAYATGTTTSSNGNVGALIGYQDDSAGASFWDTQTNELDGCGQTSCNGAQGKLTAEMKDINTFTTALGENGWDFESVWILDMGNNGYPHFRWEDNDSDGITNSIEINAPNNGDANDDGTPDVQQSEVTSFINPVTNSYAVLATTCDANISVSINAASATDNGFNYPAGLMSYTLNCSSATITQIFYGNYDASKIVARKYNSTTHTYTTIPGAFVTNVTIGGNSALKIVYTITDGGPLDEDGTVNGTIVDPSGPALNTVGAPNTGIGGVRKI